MALVGYARVSSVGQRLDVQLDKLKHCDKIFQEQKSGASGQRPRLQTCLEYVREGDTLVVTRLDRLARSTLHLCQIADALARKQVGLHVLDQQIDTGDATGRLLFHMLGAIAQFETEIRAERQMDGIRKAQERGVHFGRKKTLTPAQVAELRHRRLHGALIKTLMQDYGLSKASVYRYLGADDAPLGPPAHPSHRSGRTARPGKAAVRDLSRRASTGEAQPLPAGSPCQDGVQPSAEPGDRVNARTPKG
jgi:DNA invertase Pin-like site-specific DNA recombinase